MIAYGTFFRYGGVTAKGMMKAQEQARAEAEAFIARELNGEDVVGITESALPSTWGRCLVSVTVWSKRD